MTQTHTNHREAKTQTSTMNGSEPTSEGAQKPPPVASTANGENGESAEAALAKKRKKDGLKPIITTEGQQAGYVGDNFLCSARDGLGSFRFRLGSRIVAPFHCAFCSVEFATRPSGKCQRMF
jgi:hypothetical protein